MVNSYYVFIRCLVCPFYWFTCHLTSIWFIVNMYYIQLCIHRLLIRSENVTKVYDICWIPLYNLDKQFCTYFFTSLLKDVSKSVLNNYVIFIFSLVIDVLSVITFTCYFATFWEVSNYPVPSFKQGTCTVIKDNRSTWAF